MRRSSCDFRDPILVVQATAVGREPVHDAVQLRKARSENTAVDAHLEAMLRSQ